MGRIRRRYVDGPFGQVHLAEIGEGCAILCIHQTPRSSDEFSEIMQILGDEYRVIAMDLPGMGASDAPAAAATIQDYAAAAAVIAQSVPGGVIACGHHTGGVVAIELAAQHPSVVRSLILSSTPWVDESARRARVKRSPIDAVDRDGTGLFLLELWNMRRPYYPPGHHYLERFMKDALAARDSAEGHLAVGNYAMDTRVSRIDCPVLLVRHQQDPFSRKHTADMVAAFPRAELVTLEQGLVALEVEAAEFASAVRTWIIESAG